MSQLFYLLQTPPSQAAESLWIVQFLGPRTIDTKRERDNAEKFGYFELEATHMSKSVLNLKIIEMCDKRVK